VKNNAPSATTVTTESLKRPVYDRGSTA